MLIFLIIIIIITLWSTLSTFVYKIMRDVIDIDPDDDPRIVLGTVFSPISILILIGYGIGIFIIKKLDKFRIN